jgi:hypothetical protein
VNRWRGSGGVWSVDNVLVVVLCEQGIETNCKVLGLQADAEESEREPEFQSSCGHNQDLLELTLVGLCSRV